MRSHPFFSPPVVLVVLLFGLNNLWGKAIFPGVVTGKISDLAFCFFMPLFLAYIFELRMTRMRALRWGQVLAAIALVAAKTWPLADSALDTMLETFWNFWGLSPRTNQMDASDLLALPVTFIAYYYGLRREGTT